MAAHVDIAPRAAAMGLGEMYLSDPPTWFRKLLASTADKPIVVNVKGVRADDCPVWMTLAEYELLTGKGYAGSCRRNHDGTGSDCDDATCEGGTADD